MTLALVQNAVLTVLGGGTGDWGGTVDAADGGSVTARGQGQRVPALGCNARHSNLMGDDGADGGEGKHKTNRVGVTEGLVTGGREIRVQGAMYSCKAQHGATTNQLQKQTHTHEGNTGHSRTCHHLLRAGQR